MGLMGNNGALDASSTWIPVVKNWTSTRDFDVLSPTRFSTWFKEHKAQRETEADDKAHGAHAAKPQEGGER